MIMKDINGQFIMDGCAPDAPDRLDNPEQLVTLLRSVGFLPLFSNAIQGFSVEEHVPSDLCGLVKRMTLGSGRISEEG